MAKNEIDVIINRFPDSSELEVVTVEKKTSKYDCLYSAVKGIDREGFWNGLLVPVGVLGNAAGVVLIAREAISWVTSGNVDFGNLGFGVTSIGNATAVLVTSVHDFKKTSKVVERLRQSSKI